MLSGGVLSKPRHRYGQGLVEFAIILPILLMTMFVIIEMARVLHAWMVIENGARTGVRYAVTGEYDPLNCDNGATDDKCMLSADEVEARVESIHAAAWAGSSSIVRVRELEANADEPSFFKVTVCDPDDIDAPASTFDVHTCPGVEDPGNPGDLVTVVLEFNHPLILPGLSAIWPQLRLSAQRDATVETFRILQSYGSPPTVVPPPPPATNTPPPTPTESLPPGPDCDKLNIVSWTWKTGRFYIIVDDTNEQDGYLGSAFVDFPNYVDGHDYFLNHARWHPNASRTSDYQVYLTNENLSDDWSASFSTQSNSFRVSPGSLKSRMSVAFGGNLFDDDLPGGTYYVEISVYYPGFSTICEAYETANKTTTIPKVTSAPREDSPPRPTSELPPTNTPGSEPGPTEPPPTARD